MSREKILSILDFSNAHVHSFWQFLCPFPAPSYTVEVVARIASILPLFIFAGMTPLYIFNFY